MWKGYAALAVLAFVMVVGVSKLLNPGIKAETFVETPELYDKWYVHENAVRQGHPRTSERVDPNAAESVIRWPRYFRSKDVDAPPIELRIPRAQWVDSDPVKDMGFLAPDEIRLTFDWPEDPVSRAKAPLGEKPPSVRLRRSHGGARDPDVLMDAARRGDVLYASPAETPRDKVVVLACSFYDGQRRCEALFEYRGRTAYVSIPYRRHQAWQYGVEAARNMLDSVTKPL